MSSVIWKVKIYFLLFLILSTISFLSPLVFQSLTQISMHISLGDISRASRAYSVNLLLFSSHFFYHAQRLPLDGNMGLKIPSDLKLTLLAYHKHT